MDSRIYQDLTVSHLNLLRVCVCMCVLLCERERECCVCWYRDKWLAYSEKQSGFRWINIHFKVGRQVFSQFFTFWSPCFPAGNFSMLTTLQMCSAPLSAARSDRWECAEWVERVSCPFRYYLNHTGRIQLSDKGKERVWGLLRCSVDLGSLDLGGLVQSGVLRYCGGKDAGRCWLSPTYITPILRCCLFAGDLKKFPCT